MLYLFAVTSLPKIYGPVLETILRIENNIKIRNYIIAFFK